MSRRVKPMENLTTEALLGFMVVLLALMNLYNVFSSARKNAREEKKHQQQPTADLKTEVSEISKKLDTDKRRLDNHDERLDDLKKGLMATCTGVQALLEHELHNGNTAEMQEASKGIDKWLRERP